MKNFHAAAIVTVDRDDILQNQIFLFLSFFLDLRDLYAFVTFTPSGVPGL
jgi:hypothetical protein